MTDFINSLITDMLTQINDLSFGDVIEWWIAYLIGTWVLTGMADSIDGLKTLKEIKAKKNNEIEYLDEISTKMFIACQHAACETFPESSIDVRNLHLNTLLNAYALKRSFL
ncbi:TPA: hypothetical protein NIK62_000143 [Vibrio cholerae]|uniref:hypothetical protein n=1 Tax=Vibrio cholerae TaxID=666 RepID=UPI0004E2CF59|nr:hypothetical protein [Vibrio cholerae]KFE28145.1 hypothetical protein DN30_1200 [Vibrio cholerae]TXY40891.1 hypothetical protein FXE84_17635 [Vibrio cholerae]GHW90046.1 hypothetical protein VCSRO105_0631 [Vibrio cholerae]HCF7762717.1 hypothetical protein [Vibrio cholerae]